MTSDEDGWIALAPLVQADRDLQDAGWKWDGHSAAFSAGKPRALVSIPVRIAGSYELQTRVTITRAKEVTAICLPITGTRAVVLDMRGDRGNSESPTATIRLTGLKPEAEPRGNVSMEIGTEYALSCKVLVAGNKVAIEIRRDGRVLFQWVGERSPSRRTEPDAAGNRATGNGLLYDVTVHRSATEDALGRGGPLFSK